MILASESLLHSTKEPPMSLPAHQLVAGLQATQASQNAKGTSLAVKIKDLEDKLLENDNQFAALGRSIVTLTGKLNDLETKFSYQIPQLGLNILRLEKVCDQHASVINSLGKMVKD